MSFVFGLFILLIVTSPPLLLLVDGPFVVGLLLVYVALCFGLLGLRMPAGEARHFVRVIRPFVVLAAVPALWMMLQVAPVPAAFGHSIWRSAQAALPDTSFSHISIDLGATLVSLAEDLGIFGIFLIAAATSIDRRRAEYLLTCLLLITSLAGLCIIIHDAAGMTFLGEVNSATRTAIDTMAALGLIAGAAKVDMVIERYETRHARAGMSRLAFFEGLIVAAVCLLASGFAIVHFSNAGTSAATIAALVSFAGVVAVRRLGLTTWMSAGLAAAALAAFGMFIISQWRNEDVDVTVRFAETSPTQIAAVDQMARDASWAGSGAGTFPTLASLYRQSDEPATTGSTAAALIKIEMGSLGLWGSALSAALAGGLLLRGALRRGRDSFFPAAAASGLVLLAVQVFSSGGPLQLASAIPAAVLLGLGAAQRVGRTVA